MIFARKPKAPATPDLESPDLDSPDLDSIVPQRALKKSSQQEDEAHDQEIMDALRYADEKPGLEPGTDESLNESNSALSENPSNGRWPRDAALD